MNFQIPFLGKQPKTTQSDYIEKYSAFFIKNAKTLTREEEKSPNYLLVAARDLFYFAGLLGKNKRFRQSIRKLHNKTLDIREKILGEEHSNTAASYNEIGYVYRRQGNYSQAVEYLQNKPLSNGKLK